MKPSATIPSTAYLPAPVEAIAGVWKFSRSPHFKAAAHSLPGHLLHWVAKGSYTLKTNGREYRVKAGDLIYYHESEEVLWTGDASRVVFYSVGFLAPRCQPLPIAHRVSRADASMKTSFLRLYKIWDGGSVRNQFEIHALMNAMLNALERSARNQSSHSQVAIDSPWWRAEAGIRERRLFRPSLSDLARLAGVGRSVLIRSCKKATSMTPMQRIRDIRMEEACGLITFAHMNFSQIADYLGYSRVHEFSREFATFHGKSPREFKRSLCHPCK
ncbi:MAG: AraC family transcriptional regulator [bacterium]|jgi:AraC-like DNA-binding protein